MVICVHAQTVDTRSLFRGGCGLGTRLLYSKLPTTSIRPIWWSPQSWTPAGIKQCCCWQLQCSLSLRVHELLIPYSHNARSVFCVLFCVLSLCSFSSPPLAVVTGWETENKYRIRNTLGQDVYFANESKRWMSVCTYSWLTPKSR